MKEAVDHQNVKRHDIAGANYWQDGSLTDFSTGLEGSIAGAVRRTRAYSQFTNPMRPSRQGLQ